MLKQPTKFSPSKISAEAAAKRRILNQQDVSPDKTGSSDQKSEENADKETPSTKKRKNRGTGGSQPKGMKALRRGNKNKKAEAQDDSSTTESEVSGEAESSYEDDYSTTEPGEGSHDRLPKATQGSREEQPVPAPNPRRQRGSKKKTSNPHYDGSDIATDDRVGFSNIPSGRQGSAINLAQIAHQFENMDKLRAMILGKDQVLPMTPPPPPAETKDEKLSMREMFTLFTDFAKAVRDPVAPASVPPPAPAPALVPVPSAP